MKKFLIALLTISSMSAFAGKAQYCKTVEDANLKEITRLIGIAEVETDSLKINEAVSSRKKVEEALALLDEYCSK